MQLTLNYNFSLCLVSITGTSIHAGICNFGIFDDQLPLPPIFGDHDSGTKRLKSPKLYLGQRYPCPRYIHEEVTQLIYVYLCYHFRDIGNNDIQTATNYFSLWLKKNSTGGTRPGEMAP